MASKKRKPRKKPREWWCVLSTKARGRVLISETSRRAAENEAKTVMFYEGRSRPEVIRVHEVPRGK